MSIDSKAILTLEIKDGMCYFQAEGEGEAYKILDFLPVMYDSMSDMVEKYMKENSTVQ